MMYQNCDNVRNESASPGKKNLFNYETSHTVDYLFELTLHAGYLQGILRPYTPASQPPGIN
jgi:hypothetical protein